MAEDTRTSDGLESDVYIYPASTLMPDDDQVPTGEHDSEDEPLSTFRSQQRKEVNSSDQSDEEPLINKRRRMDQRTAAPDTLTTQNLCNRAKKESLQEAKQREEELLIHQASLDNVLAANGFVRVPIIPDGNCFFEAAVTQIEDVTSTELRSNLCDLLEEHQQEFINFFEDADGADVNATEMSFLSSVQDLRCEGRWCSNVADLLPLALAEWTQRQVTIFTSNENKPKIDVTPLHNPSAACVQPGITLALFQCYPQHYDACVSVADNIEQTSSASMSNLSDIPQNMSRDCSSSVTDQSPPIDTSQTPPASPGVPQRQSTPRKQGQFTTPPKKKLVRKRTAKPETWKKNIRKTLKLQGKAHVSQSGKQNPAKKISSVDCSSCRFDCRIITQEERKSIFDIFYALPTYDRQKQFICSNVDQQDTPTMLGTDSAPLPKKRNVSRRFFFTVQGRRVRVCKKFFLATLDIGEGYVHHALTNSNTGTFTGADGRGRHAAHNRTLDKTVEYVKDHIRSFPCVESHYTRKDTQRQYLDPSLTVTKMYHLYQEKCAQDGLNPVSCRKYRDIFTSEFNLSFHKPKKDQCVVCVKHSTKQKQGLVTEEEEIQYQKHIEMKEKARKEKTRDKELAKADPTKHVVTLDLQAVLPTPCGMVSQLYYKRKLSVYNFTVYSLADGKATCFVWDETQGKRGSVEIATCLFMYLQSLPVSVKEVTIFSDCCGGQNRNQYLAAAFLYALEVIPNIVSITHKYLETGHTQMECDSMHSAISFAKKASPVYRPSGWDIVIRMARRTNPYVVIPVRFTQILDFKHLASQIIRNTKVDKEGKKVSWLKMKLIHFTKSQEIMFFKYDFEDTDYHQLCLSNSSAKRRRPPLADMIKPRYTAKLPVSEAKKKDLLSLCQTGVIPEDHHAFYQNLPTGSDKIDRLDDLDAGDGSGEETD